MSSAQKDLYEKQEQEIYNVIELIAKDCEDEREFYERIRGVSSLLKIGDTTHQSNMINLIWYMICEKGKEKNAY